VTDVAAFRTTLTEVLGHSGHATVLVYTPALPPDVDIGLASYPLEAWQSTFAVYVTGFLVAFQEGLRLMRPGGHIVALGSAVTRFDGQHLPPLFAGHYSAAKAALNELCKWGRREAHRKGVLLSRVAPGALDVPYHREAPEERRPRAMLPVPVVVGQIVMAVNEARELDLEIVAPA
jgi:3-oxoacyl-[acyl-carrier protein] reductase